MQEIDEASAELADTLNANELERSIPSKAKILSIDTRQ
tara:strand:- start:285 stop:398 length:114 start_codon:yes stop_codon:yes gene_type:complete